MVGQGEGKLLDKSVATGGSTWCYPMLPHRTPL